MERGGDAVLRAGDRVELAEGIERIGAAFIDRKGQRTNFRLVDEVFRTFGQEKTIPDERTAQIKARRGIAKTHQVSTADAEVGQWIIQAVIPLVSAGSRFRADHTCRKASVLRQVRRLHDLE